MMFRCLDMDELALPLSASFGESPALRSPHPMGRGAGGEVHEVSNSRASLPPETRRTKSKCPASSIQRRQIFDKRQ